MSAGPVNMHIDKAGYHGPATRVDLPRATRDVYLAARADAGNFATLNDQRGVGNFFERSKGAIGVDYEWLHG
jgi:hypothetical protein